MALPRPKSYISIGCCPLVHQRRSNMISEENTTASTRLPDPVSGNEIASGPPDRSEVPPDQPLGSEAPPDVPMDSEAPPVPPADSGAPPVPPTDSEAPPVPPTDSEAPLVPPIDSEAPPAPMDSEMAPKPMESVDPVRSEAFDGNLSDLTPPSSPQREDSITGGIRTPLEYDKLGKLGLIPMNYFHKYYFSKHI